jgi:type IV pilus assembly protein PilQ
VLNLRTAERVPRLVLREAPVEDVLALLARAAGLNLAYVAEAAEDSAIGEASGLRTISLDVENESVQEVFNNVLRLSGLEANLMGNTVVVGSRLPDEARNIITRTLRLNQTEVATARDFLLAHGAEAALVSTQIQSQTIREGTEEEGNLRVQTFTTTRTRLEPLTLGSQDSPYNGYAALPLRGLLVSIAPRSTGITEVANEISLTGDPRKVEIATQLLSQLETRRRQVAVNVKIVDVSLSNQDIYNSSFSFGVGDTFVTSDGGAGLVNFGGANPPSNLNTTNSIITPTVIPNPFADAEPGLGDRFFNPIVRPAGSTPVDNNQDPLDPRITDFTPGEPATIDADGVVTPGTPDTYGFSLPDLFQYPTRFLATLQAQVVNGNAKILTDPTLVIQEGQTSVVSLTSEVVGQVTISFSDTPSGTRETRTVTKQPVGLTLAVSVSRVDDNGFVTITANPSVSSPVSQENTGDGAFVTLIQQRSVNSGQVRMRDGQTLILSGIIQDTDRTTVTKVPILGDIPLLGALFRSTNRTNERQEVIVLLTPNVLDDSDNNTFGYGYTPSREARDILEQQGNFQYPGN